MQALVRGHESRMGCEKIGEQSPEWLCAHGGRTSPWMGHAAAWWRLASSKGHAASMWVHGARMALLEIQALVLLLSCALSSMTNALLHLFFNHLD